jgi:octaprenyl-diphosphate synthase
LVGDFLLGQAFKMMVEVGSLRALEILSSAAAVIAEGEVMQLAAAKNTETNEDEYLAIIRAKTAELFGAACEVGPVIAGRPKAEQAACRSYGINLGVAFQLVDDLLDYDGDSGQLGKNVGDDLREGKPTLPLLVAMQRGTPADRELIRHSIEHGEVQRLADIVRIVKDTGALDFTRNAARSEAAEARRSLTTLPPSLEREALLELCLRSAERSS